MKTSVLPTALVIATSFLLLSAASEAAITLTIVTFTTTTFTVAVSGTLDLSADKPTTSVGSSPSPSLFGIVLNSTASTPFYTGLPSEVSNTLSTLHPYPTNAYMGNTGFYALTFSYDQTFPQSAGSMFSGSATFTGNFNPSAALPQNFQLWSGIDWFATTPKFSVFHVNAVPEPSSIGLATLGAVSLLKRRRSWR